MTYDGRITTVQVSLESGLIVEVDAYVVTNGDDKAYTRYRIASPVRTARTTVTKAAHTTRGLGV